jgi:hypothetical protein
MTGITLSEEERKALEWCATGDNLHPCPYECPYIRLPGPCCKYMARDLLAALTRDQPPEVCECGGGVEPPVSSDGVKLCGHCGRRIKETI